MVASAYAGRADAADVALDIAISPEAAYLVREWRRAHGLPQEPEATPPPATAQGRGAIDQALRLIGVEDRATNDVRASAVRVGAHWRVTVEAQGEEPAYVVDVADSIARRSAL